MLQKTVDQLADLILTLASEAAAHDDHCLVDIVSIAHLHGDGCLQKYMADMTTGYHGVANTDHRHHVTEVTISRMTTGVTDVQSAHRRDDWDRRGQRSDRSEHRQFDEHGQRTDSHRPSRSPRRNVRFEDQENGR
ncbi:hypothetical protein HOLleu_19648 [Holothuria leucospilota]|uniref:Uncharacterized protein n=1 Tax=Holothuria leucospilota TaxID=206669 RepID=A0A9Q1BZW2_HOLLE|nr:hypothetical protein HOLleu_19648 [Holothuria leucospilota]